MSATTTQPDGKQFTCPKCGGHMFGSFLNMDGTYTRQCSGSQRSLVGKEFYKWVAAGRPAQKACTFTWPQRDDASYGL